MRAFALPLRGLTGLRTRLLLLLLLLLIPMSGLMYYGNLQEDRILERRTFEEVQRLAQHFADQQALFVDQTRYFLINLAHSEAVRRPTADCNEVLARHLREVGLYANLGLAAPDGRIVCSALPFAPGVTIADRQYFREALRSGGFAIGGYQIGRITGRATVNFGLPVRGADGSITGIVFAALSLDWLNRAVGATGLPDGSTLTVVDHNGRILVRHPDPERWVGKAYPDAPLVQAALAEGRGVARVRGIDGTTRLYGFVPIEEPAARALVIAVGIPVTSVFAEQHVIFGRTLAGVLGLSALLLFAAWLVVGRLVIQPVDALVRATERIRSGDYTARTGLERISGELGSVAAAFDLMAADLQRREAERERHTRQITRQLETITALYAGARQLTRSLDVDELAGAVARAYVEVFGADLAFVGEACADGSIRPTAVVPMPEPLPDDLVIRWDDPPEAAGPVTRATRIGRPVIVADLAAEPSVQPWLRHLRGVGAQSLGVFPLMSREAPVGVIVLLSRRSGFFATDRVELFEAYAHQAAAALTNARLHAETQRRLQRLDALRTVDLAITGSLDLRVTLDVLLEQVTRQLGVDAADVLLLQPQLQVLEFVAGRGFQSRALEGTRLRLGQGYAGRAALERRVVQVPDLRLADEEFARADLAAGEGFVTYAAAPLVAKGQVKGIMEVFHRAPLTPDAEWLGFLEALAGQAAIAVDNAALFEGLQRSNLELTLAYDTTLEGWSRALDLRDRETEGHTQRVVELTLRLARAMGLREEELVHVRRGALLHDIGKMGIPDSILHKPGPLTEAEWEIMRRHPVYAYDLLSPIAYLRPALDIPYCHHEKWDGTGYPRGLQGEQIPLAARIFAVVDVLDALTSDRPYRRAWSRERALAYIREQAGAHFDPAVVNAFFRLVDGEPATTS
ncbi:MAG: GAF domain-containing protein [Armatimonadota bacterium]|nr:GAF domain-containing protein [Armatimonadota bacterium]MDR7452611.1 GAF domain-containing protein [Armatimonadota bacterium]MDR7467820.1 GAF domain-containing protein [Armatimonadota bacterium]MDR7494594.1 GAF domain-containing protein [Armatimonadota bacterium]MDR7499654.1 GAF domain-containing protein [Armatimonadota bacterium]